MKKQIFAAAIIFVLLWSVPASAREITVLLKQRVTQASIGGQSVVLTDARGMYTKPFNGTFKASYSNGAMKAGKVTYKLPVTMKSASGVVVDGVKYKGALVIEKNDRQYDKEGLIALHKARERYIIERNHPNLPTPGEDFGIIDRQMLQRSLRDAMLLDLEEK